MNNKRKGTVIAFLFAIFFFELVIVYLSYPKWANLKKISIVTAISHGQLGNQLFEYWSAKVYARKHDKVLTISGFEDLRRIFDPEKFTDDNPRALEKKFRSQQRYFKHQIPATANIRFLNGNMQSYKNLEGYEDFIRQNAIFKIPMSDRNHQLADKMSSENSVSIHVRRGDYIQEKYTLLSREWYGKAIAYINKHVKNPVYYVFSNDIKWARENLKIDEPHTFVDWNQGEDSYNDMRLMTFCKHNIIANSTFSWWGAFLGNPKNRIVIMPDNWIPWAPKWEQEIIVPGWIILPAE